MSYQSETSADSSVYCDAEQRATTVTYACQSPIAADATRWWPRVQVQNRATEFRVQMGGLKSISMARRGRREARMGKRVHKSGEVNEE